MVCALRCRHVVTRSLIPAVGGAEVWVRSLVAHDLNGSCPVRSQRSERGGSRDPDRKARRSEEHTSELQSPYDLVCRLLLEQKQKINLPFLCIQNKKKKKQKKTQKH